MEMTPETWIAIGVIVLVVGLAALYVIRAKKKGKKCIGCPDSGSCSGGCSGNCAGCACGCKQK